MQILNYLKRQSTFGFSHIQISELFVMDDKVKVEFHPVLFIRWHPTLSIHHLVTRQVYNHLSFQFFLSEPSDGHCREPRRALLTGLNKYAAFLESPLFPLEIFSGEVPNGSLGSLMPHMFGWFLSYHVGLFLQFYLNLHCPLYLD
jgi:hypothetical protein